MRLQIDSGSWAEPSRFLTAITLIVRGRLGRELRVECIISRTYPSGQASRNALNHRSKHSTLKFVGTIAAVRVMVTTKPVEFRWSAEGWRPLVRETMAADPLFGAVYAFRAKCGDRIEPRPFVTAECPCSVPFINN